MEGQGRPPRRLPPEVYWRRRIVALVALIVIVAIVWLVVRALTSGGDGADPDAPVSPAPDVTETVAPTTEPTGETSPEPDADTSSDADTSAQAATIPDCDAGDVQVAVASIPSVGADAVTFDAAVTNTGDEPCLLIGDGEDTDLLITSGEQRVWASQDCDATAEVVGKRWVLGSGKSETFQVTWPREWSAGSCGGGSAANGYYWAELTVQGIPAEAIQFQI